MIDREHQGKGYGKVALMHLLALFRAQPQAKEVVISYNVGNEQARRLYAACGFIKLGPDEANAERTSNPARAAAEGRSGICQVLADARAAA